MDQQRKVVLFIAMSLDGYIATEEDTLECCLKSKEKETMATLSFMKLLIQF
ncbi:hypothetical protein [Carnobacterium mobile]|uniref:hypothetical protein n=1 Tax=Carnobacterium mobile TaxID=2750 RepID=UPI001B80BD19|nr:hypothetical protein [Carnobacterium mobile]